MEFVKHINHDISTIPKLNGVRNSFSEDATATEIVLILKKIVRLAAFTKPPANSTIIWKS